MNRIYRALNVTLGALLMVLGYTAYAIMVVFEFIELFFTNVALFLFSNAKFIIAKNLTQEEINKIEADVEREVNGLD